MGIRKAAALHNVFVALHFFPAVLGFSVLSGVRLPARAPDVASDVAQVLPARCNNLHVVYGRGGINFSAAMMCAGKRLCLYAYVYVYVCLCLYLYM